MFWRKLLDFPASCRLGSGPARLRRHPRGGRVSAVIVLALLFVLMGLALLMIPFAEERRPSQDGVRPEYNPEHHPAVGKQFPQLKLEPLSGARESVSLADLAGQVVLVDFWGTWCPPCQAELPYLAAMAKEFREAPRFHMLAVSCGRPDLPERVEEVGEETKAFLQQSGLELPVYLDPDRVTRAAFHRIGRLQGFPTTFLLDGRGIVRAVWVGFDPEDVEPGGTEPAEIARMRRLITQLLQSKP
jgi:thiol-disulfide isomerase/thioredoxin